MTSLQLAAGSGFTLLDTSVATATTSTNLITNISNASPPRVTLATHGYQTGDIVRISNATGAHQLGAIDFRVTRVDANNFDLTWMAAIATAAAPGASARAILVSNEAYYQPKQRVITAITAANPAVVTFAAPHDFTVGQVVRFDIPIAEAGVSYGMTELNGLTATVTAISTANNTITIDVDSSGFTAFAFPLTADAPFSFAHATPVGMDTAIARTNSVNELADATDNVAIIGVRLAAGANAPAGQTSDVIYWEAYKAFNGV